MKKIIGIFIAVILAILLIIVGYSLFNWLFSSKNNEINNQIRNQGLSNLSFEDYLRNQDIIRDLPKNGVLSLRFYNFDSGERAWEESYILTKGNVREGIAENPDAEIIIHSKYVKELGNGFCDTIVKANENGDVGVEIKLPTTSFMMKYSGLLKYKSCLGM